MNLRFEPFHEKRLRGDARFIGGSLHLCFGKYSGTVVSNDGEHEVSDLLGWAEEVRVRW